MKLLAAFDKVTATYRPIELYDLKNDVAERQNLLTDAQHAPAVAGLMAYLTTTLARDTIDHSSFNGSDSED